MIEKYKRYKKYFSNLEKKFERKERKKRYIKWKKRTAVLTTLYKFQYTVYFYYEKFFPPKRYKDKKTGEQKIRAPFYRQALRRKKKGLVKATDSVSALKLIEEKHKINSYTREFSIRVRLTKGERKKMKNAKKEKDSIKKSEGKEKKRV